MKKKKNKNNMNKNIIPVIHIVDYTKFDNMENVDLKNETPTFGNVLLAAVNSVFTRHKPFFRFSGVFVEYKVGCEKYWVKVYPTEQHNQNCKGLHVCRVDTLKDDNVYYVKPENLVKWLQSVKKHLEWKRELYEKQLKAETEQEYNSIELARFMGSQF